MSATVDLWGWRARLRLARGQTISRRDRAGYPRSNRASARSADAVRVYPTPDDLANRCELRVLDSDPHADAIPWPGPSVTSITQPIDLGPFEDAQPCRVLFLRRHAHLRRQHRIRQERRAQRPAWPTSTACARRGHLGHRPQEGHGTEAVGTVHRRLATTPEQAAALLRDAVSHPASPRRTARRRRPSASGSPRPDMPALVIIIDEYAELADDAPDAMSDADSIARLGRARRRHPDRRDPAADPEGHGPGRGALPDEPADLLPRPRAHATST